MKTKKLTKREKKERYQKFNRAMSGLIVSRLRVLCLFRDGERIVGRRGRGKQTEHDLARVFPGDTRNLPGFDRARLMQKGVNDEIPRVHFHKLKR